MISYKVIALILEPYRNATSSQAAIKTSETTNPQPDHLENVDVEYEYESFDQYEEESENGQKPQDEEKGQEEGDRKGEGEEAMISTLRFFQQIYLKLLLKESSSEPFLNS